MQPRRRGLIRKSVIFFENIAVHHCLYFASAAPPAMMDFDRFWKLAEARRPRTVDVLIALIEASGALVSQDELSSRAR
jgi:hypothetical protein